LRGRWSAAQKLVLLGERACELIKYKDARLLDTLAVAYKAAGNSAQVARTAEKAKQLAGSSQLKDLKK